MVAMETDDPHFSSCLSLLTTKNDSKKLAALLLATKLERISPPQYTVLFKAIDNKFLIRLMKSQQNAKGTNSVP